MILKAEEEMKENQKAEAQQQEIQDVQKQVVAVYIYFYCNLIL